MISLKVKGPDARPRLSDGWGQLDGGDVRPAGARQAPGSSLGAGQDTANFRSLIAAKSLTSPPTRFSA